MKHFSIFTVVLLIAVIISACGSPAAPTMNAADVQNTAVAAAFTMVAQTQASMPTNTSLPPTEAPTQTSLPTDTPIPLPTLATSPVAPTVAAPTKSAGGDPCNQALNHSPLGKETTIRIWNTTKVPVTVSLYLNPTEGHGECGYRSYNLAKGADVVITDLVYGCYNLWAWSDAPKGKFNSSGSGCINNPDKWTFEINTATVKFVGP
jgi:hypothetical protein